MSVVNISRAISTHDATVAPEVTRAERDPVLDLVRAWEDSEPMLAVGRIAREALIQRIVRHTRQALHQAEKRADSIQERLDLILDSASAAGLVPCAGDCGGLIDLAPEKRDPTVYVCGTVIAHGYCCDDLPPHCAVCGTSIIEDDGATCEAEACIKRFAAEMQQ